MEFDRKAIRISSLLGIFLFPLFIPLDFAVYPDFVKQLIAIRLSMTVCLALNLILINRLKTAYLFPTAFFMFFLSSFSVSLMCFVTGDGFASSYYAGHFIVIIISTIFFPMKKNYYAAIVIGSIVQHFVMLSFLPWELGDLAKNVFFLGAFVFSGWIIRKFIYGLLSEIKILQGIIPICANCKKIRNDKGYWDQVDFYISQNSEAKFTHGICPHCAKELYGDILNLDSSPGKKQAPELRVLEKNTNF